MPLPAEPPAYRDLSGWIVLKILEAIKRGEIKSGERLVERDIAARLAVSRAPVRDAIHRLETLGVVKRAFPRGVEVRSWTERDSAEVFLLFDALILLSVQLSAGRLQPDDIVQLERILQETHENKERATPDLAHQFALDVQFHLVIARASGHGRLVEMMQSLVLPLELWPKSFEAHKHPSFQLRQHSRLLEALKTGNRDIAIDCVMSIIDSLGTMYSRSGGSPSGSSHGTTRCTFFQCTASMSTIRSLITGMLPIGSTTMRSKPYFSARSSASPSLVLQASADLPLIRTAHEPQMAA